jgi:hypothetical protein
MIAIDLDGTLLGADGRVSPRTKAAVHKCLSAGLLVCFATGRNRTESQMVLEAVDHYPTAVFAGGAMVIDTRHETTLHRQGMNPDLAREVCGVLEEMGHAVLALQDTLAAGFDYVVTADVELNQATHHWMHLTAAKVVRAASLSRHEHVHTIRLGIVAMPDEVRRVRNLLSGRFEGRIVCQSLFVPAQSVEVLEIFDPAVNKWEGVLHIARHHEIAPEQIVAIGDDVNDVPMIASAGLGVAMGNAKPEVLAVAKRVIGGNHEDGLAEFLEELVEAHLVEPEK